MAGIMAPEAEHDQTCFQVLEAFLLDQFKSRNEVEQTYNDIFEQYDEYIESINERATYHQQVLASRSIEMAVRDTLYNSQLGLPETSRSNHEEWLAYRNEVFSAVDSVRKHYQCGTLLRDEFIEVSTYWHEFWDYKEEHNTYRPGDGRKMLEIVQGIKYHETRREFLQEKFMAGRDNVVVLFDDEPAWLGFL